MIKAIIDLYTKADIEGLSSKLLRSSRWQQHHFTAMGALQAQPLCSLAQLFWMLARNFFLLFVVCAAFSFFYFRLPGCPRRRRHCTTGSGRC